MRFRYEHLPPLRAAGLPLRTDNRTEADPETARIPAHWTRFQDGPRPDGPVLGIYGAYEGDHRASYTLWAAVEAPEAPLPQGFEPLHLPSRRALVLEAEGPFPGIVIQAWEAVWSHFEAHPEPARAYGWDVERVLAGTGGRAEVRLEISLR